MSIERCSEQSNLSMDDVAIFKTSRSWDPVPGIPQNIVFDVRSKNVFNLTDMKSYLRDDKLNSIL
jgi:hypothetical protein